MNKASKTISIVRWTTRILSALIVLMFLLFFFGEADFSEPLYLTTIEIIMKAFVPILLIVGLIIAWKREILGGILTIISVILYNAVSMIFQRLFAFELEFGFFIIIGILFIICGISKRRLES